MSYQHVYTIDKFPSGEYKVTKYDKKAALKGLTSFDEGSYTVKRDTGPPSGRHAGEGSGQLFCDCFAGLMGKTCRHIEMVYKAEDEDGINSGRFLDFDKHRWLDAPQPKPVESI